MKRANYAGRLVWFTIIVVIGTIALGLIPPFQLFGMKTERVDILADLRPEPMVEEAYEYEADMERHQAELAQIEALKEEVDTLPIYRLGIEPTATESRRHTVALRQPDAERSLIAIEDFYADSLDNTFNDFIDKLLLGEEVRIAFMGDSFIEGDILTSDLREQLQSLFGGRGVGFVHCDIPFSTARRTVERRVSGWSAYSVMKPRNNPSEINEQFFISGYLAKGGPGATAHWTTTDVFEHLDSCSRARVLFISRDSSRIELTINEDEEQRHEIAVTGNILPQQILIEAPVEKLTLRVLEGTISCYGASFEGYDGVILDNLSMRSNSGHAIFGTSTMVNRQLDTLLGYDLVVLQYGLNIMQPGQRHFTAYRNKLCEIIRYAQSSFPNAAIVVLGVSDRWVMNEETNSYQPIGSVDAMASYQRAAADSCCVAFWNTAEAMALYGGMSGFVSNGWAARDYTHINFRGGSHIADELAHAIHVKAYERLSNGEFVGRPTHIQPLERISSNAVTIHWDVEAPHIIEGDSLQSNIEGLVIQETELLNPSDSTTLDAALIDPTIAAEPTTLATEGESTAIEDSEQTTLFEESDNNVDDEGAQIDVPADEQTDEGADEQTDEQVDEGESDEPTTIE